HRLSDANTNVTVWMDTFTCQTGVTRWLEVAHPSNAYPNATWTYDRTEDELIKQSPKFWEKFDYAIVEVGRTHELLGDWDEIEEIRGYGGVRLARKGEVTPGTDAVEAKLFTKVLGEKGPEVWKLSERLARLVTQGYWVEINMVPKIQILKRRREAV
ncbi:dolichyl-P-Man:Man(7)GlcNAc(2)-PP-dolichol alpha-1,6-mannosyltransferase, partial [Ascosphaera atra]